MPTNRTDPDEQPTNSRLRKSNETNTDNNLFEQVESVQLGARALLLNPFLKSEVTRRSPESALEELTSLAGAIDLEVADSINCPIQSVRPATYIGKGRLEQLSADCAANDIDVVVMNCALGPVQQQNLERALKCKVIDRTALILEIFGARARTREGVMQVELAHLSYQRGRLVRSWTHLERQRGGAGFMGGPGERQIEADRRALADRIGKLRRQLEKVTKTRDLHRKGREKVPYPIVSLVGYTNAGKSTLFNRLTDSSVYAKDQLFATLDPTMRQVILPSGQPIILSDTVGFISDLPTHLVAAFRATLEEVVQADIIVHVRDISHPETTEQLEDVTDVLASLGVDETGEQHALEVHNKIDLLPNGANHQTNNIAGGPVALSALTGQGTDTLLERLDAIINRDAFVVRVSLNHAQGEAMSWLYRNGDVLERRDSESGCELDIRLNSASYGRLQKMNNINVVTVGS